MPFYSDIRREPLHTQLSPSKQTEKPMSEGQQEEIVEAVKGFGPDWKCRGYQFELGGTYRHDGEVKACSSGFHAIEGYPMEVFGYYAPADSKYADVTIKGKISRHDKDSKVAGAELSVRVELKIPDIISRSVKFILDRIESTKVESNTGDQSAATNTGNWSAAANTGNWSAATNTGNWSAATNTGNWSAATNTGDRSAATVEGRHSVAVASGIQCKAKGADGCALFLVYRDEDADGEDYGRILHAKAVIVGLGGIKPGVFYTLNRDGEIVEAE